MINDVVPPHELEIESLSEGEGVVKRKGSEFANAEGNGKNQENMSLLEYYHYLQDNRPGCILSGL